MNFGQAIESMKDGCSVARKGWNGKGMFVYLVEGTTICTTLLNGKAKEVVMATGKGEITDTTICSHIDMKSVDGSLVVGWLASQTDMLAEDWGIMDFAYELDKK